MCSPISGNITLTPDDYSQPIPLDLESGPIQAPLQSRQYKIHILEYNAKEEAIAESIVTWAGHASKGTRRERNR